MNSYLESAILAAKKAGTFQKEKYRSTFIIREKSPANLVTEVDIQSEKFIIEVLTENHPEIGLLTEEQDISEVSSLPERWIIDPLDGTTNFAHGYPMFGVSIALERNNIIELGVVYVPILDELFTAQRGKGAHLNGNSIRVSKVDKINNSFLASGFPYDAWTNKDNNSQEWANIIKTVVSSRCDGSAAIDLCYVAAGILDGYWELDLEAWDMAAGSLIVEEAGGRVTLPNGKEFTPNQRGVLASNGLLHNSILEKLAR